MYLYLTVSIAFFLVSLYSRYSVLIWIITYPWICSIYIRTLHINIVYVYIIIICLHLFSNLYFMIPLLISYSSVSYRINTFIIYTNTVYIHCIYTICMYVLTLIYVHFFYCISEFNRYDTWNFIFSFLFSLRRTIL